jgi:putative transposase
MSRWHNLYLDGHARFCTATVSGWRPFFTEETVAVLYREWEAARRDHRVRVLAYVVMPDHFHLVLWAQTGQSIRRFLQRTLALTSRTLQPGGGFWKERPRVLPIHSEKVLKTKVDYLHANPVRGSLVADPGDWEHSSYRHLVLECAEPAFGCDKWTDLAW